MLTDVLLQIGEYFECFDGVGDLIGAVAERFFEGEELPEVFAGDVDVG